MRANYQTADRQLLRAVIETDYEAVQAAIESGADVDVRGPREEDDWGAPDVYRDDYNVLAHAIWSYGSLVPQDDDHDLDDVDDVDDVDDHKQDDDHDLQETGFRIIQMLVREGADINAPSVAVRCGCRERLEGAASIALNFPRLSLPPMLDVFEFLIGRPDFHARVHDQPPACNDG